MATANDGNVMYCCTSDDGPDIRIDPTVRKPDMDLHEKRREAGRMGGMATVAKYGRNHMRDIGKVGFQVYADRHHDGMRAAAAKSIMGFAGWTQPTTSPMQDIAVATKRKEVTS